VLPQNFQIFGEWLGSNWLNLVKDAATGVMTVFQNLSTNIGLAWNAAMNALKTRKFEVDWVPLLDGFKAQTGALPEFLKPAFISLQHEIDAIGEQMAQNEIQRAERIATQGTAAAQKSAIAAAMGGGADKFKSQEMGTADFARSVARAQGGPGGTAERQMTVMEQIRADGAERKTLAKATLEALRERAVGVFG
jgi:hypothetical protein